MILRSRESFSVLPRSGEGLVGAGAPPELAAGADDEGAEEAAGAAGSSFAFAASRTSC